MSQKKLQTMVMQKFFFFGGGGGGGSGNTGVLWDCASSELTILSGSDIPEMQLISVTKCPIALLPDFKHTCVSEYRQLTTMCPLNSAPVLK